MNKLISSTTGRIILGLLMAALGGVAFVMAFPPYEIWPLAFVGFVPILVAQHRIMPARTTLLYLAEKLV